MTQDTAVVGEEQRGALLRLLLIIAAGVVAAMVTGVTKVVLVVFAIIVIIMLHELGHFLTAKWAGMKVTEYFLGFGPRLWSVRKGETEYGIKAIPAGGYVKIIGMSNLEEVDPADEQRTYRAKPYWRRLSVAVAGSTVHFALAFILMFGAFTVVGFQDFDKELPQVGAISALKEGPSPAQQAGFQVGDRLLGYDGQPFTTWDAMRDHIKPRPTEAITFDIERNGQRQTLVATPLDLRDVEVEGNRDPVEDMSKPFGFVGLSPAYPVVKEGPVAAVGKTGSEMWMATTETVKALGRLVSPSGASSYFRQLTGQDPSSLDRPVSIVGFVKVAGQSENGWREILVLLFLLNMFVGIFNMIPLPPFDGGHVAVATYEKVRSRPGRPYRVDMTKVMPVAYVVFVLLVTLGVTSLYLDIVAPLQVR